MFLMEAYDYHCYHKSPVLDSNKFSHVVSGSFKTLRDVVLYSSIFLDVAVEQRLRGRVVGVEILGAVRKLSTGALRL
jgi:hypothetical protein